MRERRSGLNFGPFCDALLGTSAKLQAIQQVMTAAATSRHIKIGISLGSRRDPAGPTTFTVEYMASSTSWVPLSIWARLSRKLRCQSLLGHLHALITLPNKSQRPCYSKPFKSIAACSRLGVGGANGGGGPPAAALYRPERRVARMSRY